MSILDLLLYPFAWIVDKINPFPAEEYFERFLKFQIIRAKELGLSDDEIDALWNKVWLDCKDRDWSIPGQAPGSRFATELDVIEALKAGD